jgi:AcrR family transcriptional regulator
MAAPVPAEKAFCRRPFYSPQLRHFAYTSEGIHDEVYAAYHIWIVQCIFLQYRLISPDWSRGSLLPEFVLYIESLYQVLINRILPYQYESSNKALNTEYAALMAEKNYFCLLTGNRSVTIIGVTEWLPARRNIMAGDTKERILETALELFAQNGYLGTSMNDIAKQLGFTKAALYKHYTSKQEILDRIVERMNEMDYERAESYEMPETEPDGFAEAYLHTPISKIRAYSKAQFEHWTKEPFSSNFRKMLTLEQYRDPKLAQLHHDYLAGGPLEYMAAIFRKLTDTDEAAMQLALEFYGPMYLLYSVYDGAQDKDSVAPLLDAHIEQFIAKVESCCRKERETI